MDTYYFYSNLFVTFQECNLNKTLYTYDVDFNYNPCVIVWLIDNEQRMDWKDRKVQLWFFRGLQQQRPDISRLLQQMHAQQLPPGTALGAHPGLPGLPGLGPAAGLPVPTSASAALLSLGLTPGAATAPGTTAAHPLSMLSKPELHRQPDDLKSNGGEYILGFSFCLNFPTIFSEKDRRLRLTVND